MSTDTRSKVAAEVRASLARANLSAADITRSTGIPVATLGRKLRGESSFSVEELDAICDVAGTEAWLTLRYALSKPA